MRYQPHWVVIVHHESLNNSEFNSKFNSLTFSIAANFKGYVSCLMVLTLIWVSFLGVHFREITPLPPAV